MKLECALIASLALSATPQAQVLHVRADTPPGGNGATWALAFKDLQLALASARSNPSILEIWVARGTYKPAAVDTLASFSVREGLSLYGGFAGTETSVGQRNLALNVTTLDGDLNGDDSPGLGNRLDNSRHVITSIGVSFARVDGFRIRGGTQARGGGLRLIGESFELANLEVLENGSIFGGGLYAEALRLQVRDSRFHGNRIGVELLYDDRFLLQSGRFERCSFESNDEQGLIANGSFEYTLRIIDCEFRENAGGGLHTTSEQTIQLEVERSLFDGNIATDGAGIGVHSQNACSIIVSGCTFRDAVATSGGGISVQTDQPSDLTVADSAFLTNHACAGGGVFFNSIGGTVLIQRCVFRGNFRTACGVGSGGDGLRLERAGQAEIVDSLFWKGPRALVDSRANQLRISRSTLVNAGTVKEALLVKSGNAVIEDSILWGDGPAQMAFGSAGMASARYSNVGLGGTPLPGPGNLDVDPQFVNAAAGDLHLLPGSPCIDAGDPLAAPVGADFERDSRLLDGNLDGSARLDLGADEHARVHLEVLGTPAPGNTLTFVTTGAAGPAAVLVIGRPGSIFFPGAGTVFVRAPAAFQSAWPAPPSSRSLVVPPGASGLFHAQEIVFGPGAVALSNYVPLQF